MWQMFRSNFQSAGFLHGVAYAGNAKFLVLSFLWNFGDVLGLGIMFVM